MTFKFFGRALFSASSNYNSSNGYNWCNVNTDGTANNNNGNNANGLAPDLNRLLDRYKVTYFTISEHQYL